MPKNTGRKIMAATRKTKVLEKAMTAETLPFDNAVNNMLEKVLKPTNSNARENNLFPLTAREYTSLPSRVKTETRNSEPRIDTSVVVTADRKIETMLISRIFLSLAVSPEPWK